MYFYVVSSVSGSSPDQSHPTACELQPRAVSFNVTPHFPSEVVLLPSLQVRTQDPATGTIALDVSELVNSM